MSSEFPETEPPADQPASVDPVANARDARRLEREARRKGDERPATMMPARERRRFGAERILVRLVATGGIVAIAVALGAVLVAQDVAGWIVGLVTGLVSVVLAAIIWSSRQL